MHLEARNQEPASEDAAPQSSVSHVARTSRCDVGAQPYRCRSAVMRLFYSALERAARGSATVLVRGESGTGKELAARALHAASPRAAGPFVKIDCATLPEHLLESELFGYEKGAFTGATARKPGRVEAAHDGTLFLDELGELGPMLQAKLLRLLQDREFERLGSSSTRRVNLRVLAATHRDLEGMVSRGQFREDLFYRLNVVPLWLPPLRVLGDDIAGLTEYFLEQSCRNNGKPCVGIDPAALRLIMKQPWPGNTRQLQHFIECLVVLGGDGDVGVADVEAGLAPRSRFTTEVDITVEPEPDWEDFDTEVTLRPNWLDAERAPSAESRADFDVLELGAAAREDWAVVPLQAQLREAERRALARALSATRQNRSMAARLLHISRTQLYAKLRDYGLLEPRSA